MGHLPHLVISLHAHSNGIAESGIKEMKKLIRADLSTNDVLNMPSAIAGLQMFRNTPTVWNRQISCPTPFW
jgi:hypothetical protein